MTEGNGWPPKDMGSQSIWTHEAPRLHLASWDADGPPVLLVHGMGAHSHWWDDVAPALAAKTRPVALDLRGHGDSGWREDGVYTMDGFVADLEEARHALGWERFSLVGHSLGARVALEYAAAHPERLESLAVIDFLVEGWRGGRAFDRSKARAQPYYGDQATAAGRFRLQPPGTVLDEAALRRLGDVSVKQTERGWTWKFDWRCFGLDVGPVWPTLPRVKARSLVVRGGESSLMDEAVVRKVAESLPQGGGASVPAAHHHVPLDAPGPLAELLLGFLAP